MKQLFFILFLILSFLIQSTIEAKSSKSIKKPQTKRPPSKKPPSKKPTTKKPSTQKQLPYYVQCSKPIKYHFEITMNDRLNVESFISDINYETFLKFQEENNLIEGVGINFFSNNKEDKVELSYDDKKPTVVNLTEKTYNNKPLAGYYLGYALGLIPELARKDRDSDVKVFEKNISASYKKYYIEKSSYPDTYYTTGFDFGSVMLAKPFFGSISKNKRTYMSKFYPYYENQISGYDEFSFNDYKRLNILYCKDECSKSKKCEKYGYHGNSCSSCKCTFPFNGKYCSSYIDGSGDCGSDITVKAYSEPKKKKFKIRQGECIYIIKANNPKKKVKLTIKKFKGVPGVYQLKIKYRKDKGAEPLEINSNVTRLDFPPLSSSVIISYISYSLDNKLELQYQEI